MTKKNEELLTANALAKKLGVPVSKVKKAIEEVGAQPAKIRCGCAYYSLEDSKKIEEKLAQDK